MAVFISFGKCDWHIIIPFFLCLCRLSKEIVQHYKNTILGKNNKTDFVALLIILSASKIVGSLFLVTSKQFAKPQKNIHKSYYFKFFMYFIILLGLSIVEYGLTLFKYYYYQFLKDSYTRTFDSISSPLSKSLMIFFISLLARCILKYQIFLHKLFALLGTLIAVVFFVIVLTIEAGNKTNDNPIPKLIVSILLSSFCSLMDSFKEIFEKYLMNNKFIFPYLILLTEGIVQIILVFIFNIGLNFLNEQSIKFILSNLRDCWLYYLIFFMISMCLEISRVQSNYFFGPVLRLLSDSLAFSIYLFCDKEMLEQPLLFISAICFSLITFIFTLVYTEIIILYFCGLNKFTKGNLIQQANNEIDSDFENLDKLQNPYDSFSDSTYEMRNNDN